MSDIDASRIETEEQINTYSPHTEFFGYRGDTPHLLPADFRQRFQKLSEGVYPQEPIERMRTDGYNPVIIGYAHTGHTEEIEAIKKKLAELKQQNPQLKVLQEIDPQQLQWMTEFLEAEIECKSSGTVGGKPTRPDELQRMQDYRRRLQSNNAEHLVLWCLDNGIEVKSIEHPDVKKWIQEDRARDTALGDEEESFGFAQAPDLQPFYTAVRRDIYMDFNK
ncbi:hypothetical protein HYW46_02270 [Candidatus Daviesbacteria bacterium]|nr:hypothetical protein [Candidatus Daviesbacteria bacterium]